MDTSVLASVTAYYIIPVASVSDLQSKLNVCKAYNDSLPARAARGSAFADAKLVTFKVHAHNVSAIVNCPDAVGWADEAMPALFPDWTLGTQQPGLLVRWVIPTFGNPQSQSNYRDIVRDMGDTMICASKNMPVDILGGAGENLLEDSSVLLAPPPPPPPATRHSPRFLAAAQAAVPWWACFVTPKA